MNHPASLAYSVAVWIVPLIIAIVFHEVAHGYAARAFGDRTAEQRGRLTLNPLAHVDLVGTVLLPMALAVAHAPIFGWAKPVPVVPSRMRNPRRDMMLVALAGPLSNLVLALLAALGLRLMIGVGGGLQPGGATGFLAENLFNFILINVFLAIFNLIPLPPFDGGQVLQGLLPRSLAAPYARLARFGFPLLFVLLIVLPMLSPQADIVGRAVRPVADAVTGALLGIAGLSTGI